MLLESFLKKINKSDQDEDKYWLEKDKSKEIDDMGNDDDIYLQQAKEDFKSKFGYDYNHFKTNKEQKTHDTVYNKYRKLLDKLFHAGDKSTRFYKKSPGVLLRNLNSTSVFGTAKKISGDERSLYNIIKSNTISHEAYSFDEYLKIIRDNIPLDESLINERAWDSEKQRRLFWAKRGEAQKEGKSKKAKKWRKWIKGKDKETRKERGTVKGLPKYKDK